MGRTCVGWNGTRRIGGFAAMVPPTGQAVLTRKG
jgi:hypothetical protein